MNAFSVKDDLALITGGGSGIGLGIAECMVKGGASVVIVGRRESKLKEAVNLLGPASCYKVFDVNQTEKAPDLIQWIEGRVGMVTILVNNAGHSQLKPAIETTTADMIDLYTTHVLGANALSRAVAKSMIKEGRGAILFISSSAALYGLPERTAYTAAKSAHIGLVRALAVEWSPFGVRVNGIAPGWIETAMVRKGMNYKPEWKDKIIDRTPLGRFGEAHDIGNAAVFLCSNAAKFITGVILPVDGGRYIGY